MTMLASFVIADPPIWVDGLRLMTSIAAGLIIGMVIRSWKPKQNGWRTAIAIYLALTAFGEAQQIGESFIIYQLPLRILALVAVYWAITHDHVPPGARAGDK